MSAPVRPFALLLALLLAVPALALADDDDRDRRHDGATMQMPPPDSGRHDGQFDRGAREPQAPPPAARPPSPASPPEPPRAHGDRHPDWRTFDPDAWTRYDRYRHERYVAPAPHFRPRGYRYDRLPPVYHRIELRNHTYFFFDGMFLEPRLGSYFVVRAPIGARVPFLPAGYVTFYLGPRRYFFVNATYYLWDPDEYDYVVVDEPAGADAAMAAAEEEGDADGLFVYPSQGQSEEQLRQDRFECHEWAVSQTGYDPTLAAPGSKGRADYLRAMTACLEGRGYTVK